VPQTVGTELVDSSSLLGDPDALRGRVGEDGYLFFRGLLDPGFIRQVGHNGLAALQEAGWTEPGEDPLSAPPRRPARAVRMRDAVGDPGYWRLIADPGFNCLPFGTPLSDVMGQLLGPLGVCYPLRVPRVVFPASVAPRHPGNFCHKDYGAVQDLFTCWVPMGDVSRAMGGLALVPGSQHRARVAPRPVRRLEPGWVTADYRAGDVLIFHCLTTHAALPNRSGNLRFSGEYRWQLADLPAPRRVVIGPSGQEIGVRLFGRTNWWRPVSTRLRLFDAGGLDAPAVHPAPPSRFVRFDP
jgi:Phytanoyl-CoA dioxygenase (PhyH)